MAGHPWEPSIWRGLEPSSHEAPVEALSSEGGDRTARCSQEHWHTWAPLPGRRGGTWGSSAPRPSPAPLGQSPHPPVSKSYRLSAGCPTVCPLRVWIPRSSRDTDRAPSGFVGFMGEERVTGSGSWVQRGKGRFLGTLVYSTKLWSMVRCLGLF